ncbi:hypothetical protein ABZ307_44540 [Streptomyces griseorubiginosus]|uniref:hypothetical protein n=1 Tax=Streptomyces griseorubiginosus TaxID=67304 RepID=UPI0033B73506
MAAPGRPTPNRRTRNPRRTAHGRLTRFVRHVGRLLCWSLATAMASAATDLLLAPHAPWWAYTWPMPWILTCTSALAWAVLRACEKSATDPSPNDEDPHQDEWERAA